MNKTDLSNKVGLVTGAGSGIGQACAVLLAQKNVSVVVSDINLQAAQQVVDEITADGGRAVANQCDVSNATDTTNMVKAAIETFGQLDMAINNAGIVGQQTSIDSYELDDWNRIINVNLNGVFHCLKEELRVFYEQGHGAIVNIASEAALRGGTACAAYTASKHAVAGLTKSAAIEASKRGVRVNAICPGAIETPLVKARMATTPKEVIDQAIAVMPIGRFGQPSEIAETAVWLCSDAASFVTGHLLAVDGGWSAN